MPVSVPQSSTASVHGSMSGRHPLIECRLELLDRLLQGNISRSRRLELVAESERRIDQLLSELDSPHPTDEQVLQVLARLDPPEAVLTAAGVPLDLSSIGRNLLGAFSASHGGIRRPTLRAAQVAFWLGIGSVLLVLSTPFWYYTLMVGIELMGAFPGGQEVFAYICLGIFLAVVFLVSAGGCTTSLTALWQLRRRRGTHVGYTWATLGLLVSAGPLLLCSLICLALASQIWGQSTSAPATAQSAAMGSAIGASTGVESTGSVAALTASVAAYEVAAPTAASAGSSGVVTDVSGPHDVVPPTLHHHVLPASATVPSHDSIPAHLPPEPTPETNPPEDDRPAEPELPANDEHCTDATPGGLLPIVLQPTLAVPGTITSAP